MNPLTFEVGLAWKFGLMAIFITVVAAAQVQKSGFQNDWLIILFLTGRDGPTGFIRLPCGMRHGMAMANVRCDAVFIGRLLNVLANGAAIGNRLVIHPRFEGIAQGVHVRV